MPASFDESLYEEQYNGGHKTPSLSSDSNSTIYNVHQNAQPMSSKWASTYALDREMRLRHHQLPTSPVGEMHVSSASLLNDGSRTYDSASSLSSPTRDMESTPWDKKARQRKYLGGRLSRRGCAMCGVCGLLLLLFFAVLLPVLLYVVIPGIIQDAFSNSSGSKIHLERLAVTSIEDEGFLLDLKASIITTQMRNPAAQYAEIAPGDYHLVDANNGKQYMTIGVKDSLFRDSAGKYNVDFRGMEVRFPSNGEALRQLIEGIVRSRYIPDTQLGITSVMVIKVYGIKLAATKVWLPLPIAHQNLRPQVESLLAMMSKSDSRTSGAVPAVEVQPTITERPLFMPRVQLADLKEVKERILGMVEPSKLFSNVGGGESADVVQNTAGDSSSMIRLADITVDMNFVNGSEFTTEIAPLNLELATISADVTVEGLRLCKIIAHQVNLIEGNATTQFQVDMFIRQQDLVGIMPVGARIVLGGQNQTVNVGVRDVRFTNKHDREPAWASGILSALNFELPVPAPEKVVIELFMSKVLELKDKLLQLVKQKAIDLKNRLKRKIKKTAKDIKDKFTRKVKKTAKDIKDGFKRKIRKTKNMLRDAGRKLKDKAERLKDKVL